MKKINIKKLNKEISKVVMSAGWYGVSNPFSSSFESLDGTLAKVTFLINTAVGLASLVAVVMIVYGGFIFITSGGDDDGIERGSNILTAAIVGLVIVFIANLIIRLIIDRVL